MSEDRPIPGPLDMARAELFERLRQFGVDPRTVLDVGGTLSDGDAGLRALRAALPRARLIATHGHAVQGTGPAPIGADSAFGWRARTAFAALRRLLPGAAPRMERLTAPPDRLPLEDGSIDLVLAHGLAPGADALDRVLAELRRVFAPGGLFLWTTPGLGAAAEPLDMHDLGGALARAGFIEPVLDVDRYRGADGAVIEVIHAAAFAGAARGSGTGDATAAETLIPLYRIGRPRTSGQG